MGSGTAGAFDLFGSQRGILTDFVIDGWADGVSLTSTGGGIIVDDVLIANGNIRNLTSTALGGAEGSVKYSNIKIDSTVTGFQLTTLGAGVTGGWHYLDNVSISNGAAGGIITGGRKVVLNNVDFIDNSGTGLNINRTDTGSVYPEIYYTGGVINGNDKGIVIDEQGDATWTPTGAFNSLTFKNNTTSDITGSRVGGFTSKALDLPSYQITTNNATVVGYADTYISTSFTFDQLGAGFDKQVLSIRAVGNSGFSFLAKDYRVAGGNANMQLYRTENATFKSDEILTLKYYADSTRWIETGRSLTISRGREMIVVDGWTQDNVDSSQTNVSLERYGGTTLISRRFYITKPTDLRELGVALNDARTAGTLTIGLGWNGGGPNKTVVIDGSNSTINTTEFARANTTLAVGDYLEIKITTDSAWRPLTADVITWVELEF